MAKKYGIAIGIVFLALGVLNFFVPGLKTNVLHAALHIIAGVVAIAMSLRGSDTTKLIKWITILTIIFAAMGFAGVHAILGFLSFDLMLKWVYLIIGLLSAYVYLSLKHEQAS
ncbi:MAG: hypothetical protein A3J48_02205 [Candidatus Doudnabacteria bacterium RIFCSPHIGHO2_02_FULL_46_11]|uniref:DUF4383 domain-containing protein n=1 Tax=Candidatus Doudnabacteria bacterium RIFCSPHIGHO2_02_FULL_46_11 TaxID=1817832 RepID=A0A1F5P4T8_9BACT|nr:MAG: hypothetical protein A3J48_02205 [Candidatus Doudnabacteria bacterium RIFCSPHIGHO2_02_FULL_46_11]